MHYKERMNFTVQSNLNGASPKGFPWNFSGVTSARAGETNQLAETTKGKTV